MKPTRVRYQKLTAFAIVAVVVSYGIHTSPPSASAILIGALVPAFIAFITGNAAEHKRRAAAEQAP